MLEPLILSEEELSFFRLSCDLFPIHESPLRFLNDQDREPIDVEGTFATLHGRGLLNSEGSGAHADVMRRLLPVTECAARVMVRRGSDGRDGSRSFYIAATTSVEYERDDDQHRFGAPCSEQDLARDLASQFKSATTIRARPLTMSAGDYLVFAVFARDLRSKPPADSEDAPMSLDEILAYFDEPEPASLTAPSDESWQRSIETLLRDGALVTTGDGYTLHPSLHAVAREITADRQHSVVRLDYLDEHWLMREVSLYPTSDTVYRLGTSSDGSVLIEELSQDTLELVLTEVVATLPNLVDAEVQATLQGMHLAR